MSELGDKIRAMAFKSPRDARDRRYNVALDQAASLADEHAATQLSNDERLEYQYALIWCSAAADFAPEGQAREGWLKLCKPLIDRQPIDGASRDNWNAWLDDLPLPEGFEEGIAVLQRFIAGLPADEHAATVAAAYEAVEEAIYHHVTDDDDRTSLVYAIRAMTDADARAAMDRIKAEARREGMREAAGMLKLSANARGGLWAMRVEKLRNRILAAAAKHREGGQ